VDGTGRSGDRGEGRRHGGDGGAVVGRRRQGGSGRRRVGGLDDGSRLFFLSKIHRR
jgi:hypothetical protein